MPIIAGRTREQLGVAIGYLLNGATGKEILFVGSATANGDTTSMIDTKVKGGADDHNGFWVRATSGSNDGEIVRVTDADGAGDLTVDALSNATASGDTFELWDERFPPATMHDLMNLAVMDAYGAIFDPVEDVSLFASVRNSRFDIPTGFSILYEVQRRSYIKETLVHECDTVFDETTDPATFTQVADTADRRHGSSSLKMTVAGGAAGDFVTDAIAAVDLSDYTHLEGWVKSTVVLAAADYVIHLDSGVVQADGSDLESLNVPAASANTWTHFSIALGNPETDTAIISVGLEMNVDKGAHVVWFNHLRAVNQDTQQWTTIPSRLWRIDKQARDLHLRKGGLGVADYQLLKLIGGDEPALFTSDASVNEVPDEFIIYSTVSFLLGDDHPTQQNKFAARAQHARNGFPWIQGAREVE